MKFFRWILLSLVLFSVSPLYAQLSPGDLSNFHAELEGLNNCTKCHELRKNVSPDLCLECHTALRLRIRTGTGYHSSADAKNTSCTKCHPEHLGKDFDLIYWKDGKEKFDHDLTGWELEGSHAKASCRQCHTPGLVAKEDVRNAESVSLERTYLGLGTACLDCHADEHRGQLSTNCLDCHSQDAWKPAREFSHSNTDYPLTGKHAEVQCAKCHTSEAVPEPTPEFKVVKTENKGIYSKYTGLEFRNCTPCHRDVHESKFGLDCAGCHNTSSFSQIAEQRFDHSTTGFPLVGKHQHVNCSKCHTSSKLTDPVAHAACSDCHRDEHRSQFADREDRGRCETCHTVEGFLPALFALEDHNESDYPLTGSHLAVPCFACHRQIEGSDHTSYAQFVFEDKSCLGCHRDVHQGQLDKYINESGCEFCHNTGSWHQVSFDHSKTRFPLIGKHRSTECMGCHTKESPGTDHEMIRMSPLSQECALCHFDPHQSQFVREGTEATVCRKCHSPESWEILQFDHNRDSRWLLDGAHTNVACQLCHPSVEASDGTEYIRYKPLSTACADCHSGDKQ